MAEPIVHSHNFKDITGCRFNRWTVLRLCADGAAKKIKWECRCDCGTVKAVPGGDLKSGKSKSCGCLRHDKVPPTFTDLTGRRFGRLLVVRRAANDSVRRSARWECVCDCGTLNGQRVTMTDCARLTGLRIETLSDLRKHGWDILEITERTLAMSEGEG